MTNGLAIEHYQESPWSCDSFLIEVTVKIALNDPLLQGRGITLP